MFVHQNKTGIELGQNYRRLSVDLTFDLDSNQVIDHGRNVILGAAKGAFQRPGKYTKCVPDN